MTNEQIAKMLDELSVLVALNNEGKFKAAAYEKAAGVIRTLPHNLSEYSMGLPKIPGVGEGIGGKIHEILRNGSCHKLNILRKIWGPALPLLEVDGVGPATARELFSVHKAKSLKDLKYLAGKGIITDKRILASLSGKKEKPKIAYEFAREMASILIEKIEDMGDEALACGSLRRMKPQVGDIDIVIKTTKRASEYAHLLSGFNSSGDKKVSGYYGGVQVDLRASVPVEFGSMLLYFTGSKSFNKKMRGDVKARGWKLNEYGLYNEQGKRLAGATEEGIFEALGMSFVKPQDRE